MGSPPPQAAAAPPDAPGEGPPPPLLGKSWFLLALLLLLILPTGWGQEDDKLDMLLGLGLTAVLSIWLGRRSRASRAVTLPWFALPPLLLAGYLLLLTAFGISGYQPEASVIRLLLGGALLVVSFNLFAGVPVRGLPGALQWLVLIMAAAYFPLHWWDLTPKLAEGNYRFTFWHYNALGCFLVLAFPFLLAAPWLRDCRGPSRLTGILALVAALFLAANSGSRATVGLMLLQAAVVLPCGLSYRTRLTVKQSLLATALLLLGCFTALQLFAERDWIVGKFARIVQGGESGRTYMWQAVGDLITDQAGPALWGHGAGALYEKSWSFSLADYGYFGRGKADAFAHNQILDWTLEGGFVGLFAFGAFALLLLAPLVRSLKDRTPPDRRLLRGSLLLSALSFLLFAQVSIASQFALVITLAAVVLGAMMAMLGIPARTLPLPRRTPVALLVLSLVCLAIQFPRVMGDRKLAQAARTMEAGEETDSVDALLQQSLGWDEDNVHAWYLKLVHSHHQRRSEDVEEAFRKIEERVPNLMATRLIYAAHLASHTRLAESLAVLDGYLEINAYDFASNCQFLLYAGYLRRPAEVDRGLHRLVTTHLSAIEAKGGDPPEFSTLTDPDGNTVWTLAWPDGSTRTMPLPEARERLFRGIKGIPGNDLPIMAGNARRLMGKFGFDRETLEKERPGK